MARKKLRHLDGTQEVWDDQTGLYVHTNADGDEVESRPLTKEECSMLDPQWSNIRELNEIVDQLILDMLMGGM